MRDDTELRHNPTTPSTANVRDSVRHPLSEPDRHGSVTPSISAVDDLKYSLPEDSHEFSDVWSPTSLELASDQYKFRTKVNGSVSHRHQVKFVFACRRFVIHVLNMHLGLNVLLLTRMHYYSDGPVFSELDCKS